MKTICENIENTLIIKNSKFICSVFLLESFEDISRYLEEVKLKYSKATHYPYAYIFNELKKADDDGEPTRTAGMPILNVLEKEKITNILCVVTRYFGGIKLGAGGLIRAYSKSVSNVLLKANFKELSNGYIVSVITTYNNVRELEYLLNNKIIINKEFNDKVIYKIVVSQEVLNSLESKGFEYKIIEECLIDNKNN